jgi:hypothetical protein
MPFRTLRNSAGRKSCRCRFRCTTFARRRTRKYPHCKLVPRCTHDHTRRNWQDRSSTFCIGHRNRWFPRYSPACRPRQRRHRHPRPNRCFPPRSAFRCRAPTHSLPPPRSRPQRRPPLSFPKFRRRFRSRPDRRSSLQRRPNPSFRRGTERCPTSTRRAPATGPTTWPKGEASGRDETALTCSRNRTASNGRGWQKSYVPPWRQRRMPTDPRDLIQWSANKTA